MHGNMAAWASKLEEIVTESEKRDYCCPDERASQADFVSPKQFVFGIEDSIINDSGEYEEEGDSATTACTTNTLPCSAQRVEERIVLGKNESSEQNDLNTDHDVLEKGVCLNKFPHEKIIPQSSLDGVELSNICRTPSYDNAVLSMWGADEFLLISDHFKFDGALSSRSELKTFTEVSLPRRMPLGVGSQELSLLTWVQESTISEDCGHEERDDCSRDSLPPDLHLQNERDIVVGEIFAIHRAVFRGVGGESLELMLSRAECRATINDVDEMGNTPLLLAIKLRRFDIAKTLLCYGAKLHVGATTAHDEPMDGCFGVLEEAILAGNHDLLSEVYLHLQFMQWEKWRVKASELTHALAKLPNFYIEMCWNFCSHNVLSPLVKAIAPNDTYRIWKEGTQVRVYCSIKGYSKRMFVERGKVSIIFTGDRKSESEDGVTAYYPHELLKIDHDKKKVYGVLRRLQQPTVGELRKVCEGLVRRTGNGKHVDASIWKTKGLKHKRDDAGMRKLRTYEGWVCERNRVTGNASMEIYRKSRMKQRTLSDLSEDEYFSKCSGRSTGDYEGKPKLHKKIHWNINAEMWMSKRFPLSLSHLIPILEVLSVIRGPERAEADEHERGIQTLGQLLATEGIAELGFPVYFSLPIRFGIFAEVTFKSGCRLLNEEDADPSRFDIPLEYAFSKLLQQARIKDYRKQE